MISQDLINKKLESLKSGGDSNYVQLPLLKLKEGKNTIRVLPNRHNPDFPFVEKWTHYKFNGDTFVSPKTWGDEDPLIEFSHSLPYNDENKAVKKALTPSYEVYAMVIDRDDESAGLKYWRFSKTVFTQLLEYFSDEDYGDITDINKGRDIVVKYTPKEKTKTGQYPETEVALVKPNPSKALSDVGKLKEIIESQQDILAVSGKRYTYDEIKEKLNRFFSVNDDNKIDSTSDTELGTNYKGRFNQHENEDPKKNATEKLEGDLDELFSKSNKVETKESSKVEEKDDDEIDIESLFG